MRNFNFNVLFVLSWIFSNKKQHGFQIKEERDWERERNRKRDWISKDRKITRKLICLFVEFLLLSCPRYQCVLLSRLLPFTTLSMMLFGGLKGDKRTSIGEREKRNHQKHFESTREYVAESCHQLIYCIVLYQQIQLSLLFFPYEKQG